MSRPLREVTTYLVLVFSLAIGIAVAMPHAGINVLLSALRTRRSGARHHVHDDTSRQAEGAVGQLRAEPLGQAALAVRPRRPDAPGDQCLRRSRSSWTSPDLRDFDVTVSGFGSWTLNLVVTLVFMSVLFLSEELGWRALHAAADPAAHQPSPCGCAHRVRARVLPPAAGPDRDDVRPARQPLAHRTDGGGDDHRGWRLLRLPVGPQPQRLARGDRSRHRERCTFGLGAGAVVASSQADLAYVAGEGGIATFAVVGVTAAVLLVRAKVWRTDKPVPATEAVLEPVA